MTQFQADKTPVEPKFILDKSGSMDDTVAPRSTMTRWELAYAVTKVLAEVVGAEDSAGTDEKGGGGLFTIAFSGYDEPIELGDLNPNNFDAAWSTVRPGGATYIVGALQAAKDDYDEEFGKTPEAVKPILALGILTDGALNDLQAATQWIARNATAKVVIKAIVVGYGDAHDKAIKQWTDISNAHPNVSVEAANQTSNPNDIAQRFLAMFQ